MSGTQWDVFISYASEERPWVVENLYKPLLQCRTADGRRPRVFLDTSEEGIGPGDDWLVTLAKALHRSRRIVPVYSPLYFSKRMCQWELRKTVDRLLVDDNALVPVLIDAAAAKDVPDLVSHIQYVDIHLADWFARLCRALALEPQAVQLELRFLQEPKNTLVSHTLPPLEIGIFSGGQPEKDDDEISISAEGCVLRGTTTVRTQDGVARFSDLSIGDEHASIRFIATAEGCASVLSVPISISTPETGTIQDSVARIRGNGEPMFFEDSSGLAMISAEAITVYSPSGVELGSTRIAGHPRVIRRAGDMIAVATWQGTVFLAKSNGVVSTWDLSRADGLAAVPGDLTFDRSAPEMPLYAGLWTGDIYRLVEGRNPETVLRHDGGIQALAWDKLAYVCDLNGDLTIYQGSRTIARHTLERTVRGLKYDSGSIVAAGETALYYSPSAETVPFRQAVKLGPLTTACMEPASPVAIDDAGRGLVFDRDLFILHGLHLGAGALPIGADRLGRYIYRLPGGAYDVVVEGKTIYHHVGGPLAVAPRGDLWAVGDNSELRVVTQAAMEDRLRKENSASSV